MAQKSTATMDATVLGANLARVRPREWPDFFVWQHGARRSLSYHLARVRTREYPAFSEWPGKEPRDLRARARTGVQRIHRECRQVQAQHHTHSHRRCINDIYSELAI